MALILAFSVSLQAQDNGELFREPAISNDGSTIAFSFQGDIWTVPFTGGEARRLTVHEAYESGPVFSPTGDQVAFNGNRFGNNDLFTVPVKGGVSERITWYSGNDALSDWTHSGKLLFNSNRLFNQVEWDPEIQSVPASGGTPQRALDALGNMPAMSPNGRYIAIVRGSCRIAREQYDGPADKDVWLYDTKTKTYTLLNDNSVNEYLPKWKDDQTLYFISARSGKYNIYSLDIKDGKAAGEAKAITGFKEDGVRHFDVAENGDLVFERQTSLFTQKANTAKASKLDISVTTDYRFYPTEHMTFTDDISDYSISPNGELAALSIRGEIFIKKNDKDIQRTVNVSDHPYREPDVAWLNDSTVVFTSDREGQYDLYMAMSSDENKTDIFKSLKHKVVRLTKTEGDESNPVISPDGKKIVYQVGRGTLVTASINSEGTISDKKTLLDGWSTPGGVAWSPDSKWLAYSLDDLYFNSEIYIRAADNSTEPVNVTMHPKGDYAPVWSMDGSKLGFISDRNNGDNDIWFVWLKEADWLKTQEDRDEGFYFEEEEPEDGDDDEEVTVEIDFDNIHERLQQVTSNPGNESNLVISKDGETFYYTAGNTTGNGSDLYSIKFDGSEAKQLTEGGQSPYGMSLSPDGEKIYALKRGRLNEVDNSGKFTSLPFRASMTVDHAREREQIFEEAWSALNQGFYDPKFHGYDWKALKKKYKPWTLSASTDQDFRFMFNWMLGQLNASHMGLYGSNPEDVQRERTGLIGIEVVPVKDGVKVAKVLKNSPADREVSKLYEGDIITKVDGKPVTGGSNFYSYFVNDASEQILMEVKNAKGKMREIVIRPTTGLGDELYESWIDSREALTDKYSDGRLGYIHVEGMNWPSFERFERELMAQGNDKEGIVIDVRWNGGGWTTDYLMTVLSVRQHAYTIPRGAVKDLDKEHEKYAEYYPYSERLPLSWWTKPSVAMSNESSYSNAEIFSHAYKTLDMGTLVGMPTFGAVISTGGQGLLDGSFVRMPFRAWYVKATGENMEHGPAVPDILINNEPDSKAKGEDPQLKKAVEVLLEQIDAK